MRTTSRWIIMGIALVFTIAGAGAVVLDYIDLYGLLGLPMCPVGSGSGPLGDRLTMACQPFGAVFDAVVMVCAILLPVVFGSLADHFARVAESSPTEPESPPH